MKLNSWGSRSYLNFTESTFKEDSEEPIYFSVNLKGKIHLKSTLILVADQLCYYSHLEEYVAQKTSVYIKLVYHIIIVLQIKITAVRIFRNYTFL